MDEGPPQITDFYADYADSSTRGALLYQNMSLLSSERMVDDVGLDTPMNKCCSRFPSSVIAPQKPSDPLYELTKWTMVCKSDSVSEVCNIILEGVDSMISRKVDVSTNLSKCKISIKSGCGLCIKIKFFSVPENPRTFMVMFRKDAGDWFGFSSFFNICVKFMESRGMCISI